MLEPSASRFWQAALQSGLADAQAMQACWDAIPDDKRQPEHVDRRLARQAVQSGLLTLWQAQQLIAGRSGGFKIDRYVLLDLIGQGGMGRVYLARDSRLNRRVAVKILSPERVNNPRAIARFHREALVGAQLQHENLVRIYDEGEAGGKCYLVMEYIEGKNIGQMIAENGPIPPAVAARLTLQVALGLEHAQRKGLIHRDVNPYNILVTRDGIAKLTDMGLAIDLADTDRVTRDGATVGTFDYVSPEQARHSHSVDTRSDIYSLGCSLHHMLTGEVPYPAASLPEKLFGHQGSEPAPIESLAPDVPRGLAEVVRRMMRKTPEERYATPLELAQALEPFAEGVHAAGSDSGGSSPSRSGLRPSATVTHVSAAAGNAAAPPIPTPRSPTSPLPEPPSPTVAPAPAPASVPEIVAPILKTPTPESASNDEGLLGLGISFGPEPPLSEGFGTSARSRAKARATLAKSAPVAPEPHPEPASEPEPEPNPEPNPEPAAAAVPTSSNDEGLLGLGIAVNLGPEPPLTRPAGASARPPAAKAKPKAKARTKARTGPKASASASAATARPRWVVPAASAAGLIVAAIAAAVLYPTFAGVGAPASKTEARKFDVGTPSVADKGKDKGDGEDGGGSATKDGTQGPGKSAGVGSGAEAGQGITVVAGDGTRTVEADLATAARLAIGSRGFVLLQNSEPLKVPAAGAIRAASGLLIIRAGEGARPVLEVEIKGDKPFLSSRSDSSIVIEGVTIVARFADAGKSPNLAAVIEGGSDVTLDRCLFRAVGASAGTRAVMVDGGALTATGCWFENFERALDLSYYERTATRLRHCVFVRPRPVENAPEGWAARLLSVPGGADKTGRRLEVEHCTVLGLGFLDFAGFSEAAPMRVSLSACAVRANALIAWGPPRPFADRAKDAPGTVPPVRAALGWSGQNDQYEILGKSWVVLAPDKPMPDGPADLDAWTKQLGAEADPVAPPVRFTTDPASLSEHPEPRDLAVISAAPPASRPGADPSFVGPGASRAPVAARKR